MIGIIGAMQIETAVLVRQMKHAVTEVVAETEFVQGKLHGVDAVIATCGPGKVFAATAATILIERYHATCILNVGVAGTLTAELHIGDLAIAQSTVQHDMDTSVLGDTVGEISKINVTYFFCATPLILAAEQAAEEADVHAKTGVIATGDQFIQNREIKQIIVDRFDAIACEMEGGAIGHVCYLYRVPYLVLRTISDEADESAPGDFLEFAQASAQKMAEILAYLLPAMQE